MKYLSTFLFLGLMYWTWNLANDERPIAQSVHVSIQEDLKKLIADYVQENLPNSQNLRFERFWTEALNDNRVKASFVYSFDDANDMVGEARVQIEGYALLNRAQETTEAIEWSFDELVVLNNQVDYKNPLKISPNDTSASDEAVPSLPSHDHDQPTPAESGH